jgi:RNA polymerase sigma-70 factor, ECF subfamily
VNPPLSPRAHTSRMSGSSPTPASAGAYTDFESFFRVEHPRLLAIAVAMVGDREVARELVQDALLKAFSSWTKVAALESPGGWTRRVLINLSIDVQRRRGRERRALERSQEEAAVESPPLPTPALWSAVRSLPRLQRSVVALHYVDDMPIAEVAEVLGVSPGSVKTSLSRARSAMAPTVSAHLHGEVGS